MWVLDPVNSRELLERLRPHSQTASFEVLWCGEGWKALVGECHDELLTVAPGYRFFAIKEKWGVLEFQARPGADEMTAEVQRQVDAITEKYSRASESICEWCGEPGTLRSDQSHWQTLCDRCAEDPEISRHSK